MEETLEEQPKEGKVYSKYTRDEIHEATLAYFNGDNLATEVWINKYCLKDSDGNLYEKTPDDMHWRLAKELARIEKKYTNPLFAEEIYEKIKHFKKIVPQGSPMSGIGNDFQIVSISNCFVIGNENEADSYGGIFKLDQEIAQLQKRRAGVGVDLSFIRPEGSPVKNSALTSTGIVPFMERFSNTTREVAQDGRRGALMESISIKHPDAEAFIDAKLDGTKVTGANVSVKIDDDFMEAATQGTTYTQQYPINSNNPTFTKEVNASKIWKKIIHNAWDKAEPGILYWDTLINESVPDCYSDLGFKTISTNPCLTLDSNIMTDKGNKTVEELIGVKFIAMVDGGFYSSTDKGFFITGENRDVFQITTKKGFKIKSTDNHEFKQVLEINRNDKKYKWTELKNFQIGDTINLNNNIGMNWNGEGNFEEGWLIGSLLGDGTFDNESAILRYWGEDRKETKNYAIECIKNNLKYRLDLGNSKDDLEIEQVKSVNLKKLSYEYGVLNDKRINNKIEKASSKFYKGFLCGWFDADGTVNNNIEKGVNVRLASSILENLYVAQRMLSKIGIISTVYENRREEQYKKMPDGNGGYKMYKTKSQHELSISKDNLLIFQEEINFIENSKKNKLKNALNNLDRGLYRERFVDTIKSIEYVGVENVYDCQIPDKNEFDANGISTHNCGEIPLCANDSCRLLAINLFGYVVNPFTDNAFFDWESFKIDVRIAEKLMDDIIDLELEKIDKILAKIDSDPEDLHIRETERNLWVSIKDKAERGRRTGLGITAEGDMLAALGLTYGTDEANKFSEEVHKQLKLEAYRSSVYMARDRGAFPMYDTERELNNPFIQRIKDEDSDLYDMMVMYGRRNLALLTIAPTGTVSIMTQTTSGIEPVFLVYYTRRRKINPNDKNVRVDFTDELGDTWMEYPVFHHNFVTWLEVNGYDVEDIIEHYTSDQINELVKLSPYYGATSNDVDWVKKVEMQGMVQKHIDHSISVTVNLPNDVTEETVANVYEAGWKHGCKGITVYRDGSRSGVLVTETEKKKKEKDKLFKDNHAPKRPKRLKAEIIRFQNNLEKWIGVVGMMDGRPYEVFTGRMQNGLSELPTSLIECEVVKVRDENGIKRYDIEYVDSNGEKAVHTGLNHTFNEEYWNYAKMISSVLRHGMPIIYVLDLIQSLNLNDEHLNTWKNGVARVIKKYINDGEKGNGTCPNCGSDNLEYKEGCLTCVSCGNSKCG